MNTCPCPTKQGLVEGSTSLDVVYFLLDDDPNREHEDFMVDARVKFIMINPNKTEWNGNQETKAKEFFSGSHLLLKTKTRSGSLLLIKLRFLMMAMILSFGHAKPPSMVIGLSKLGDLECSTSCLMFNKYKQLLRRQNHKP
jgi:hypothetical protein